MGLEIMINWKSYTITKSLKNCITAYCAVELHPHKHHFFTSLLDVLAVNIAVFLVPALKALSLSPVVAKNKSRYDP